MDFAAEEELCQQAYEVWLHYACQPPGDGAPSGPPARREGLREVSPTVSEEGPCSVLPLIFSKSGACFFSNPAMPTCGFTRRKAQ